jgi:hypothetical protein
MQALIDAIRAYVGGKMLCEAYLRLYHVGKAIMQEPEGYPGA